MTTRAFYLRHREKILAKSREYNRLHPEILKKSATSYRARHRAKVLARARERYHQNKDRAAAQHRRWVGGNREKRAAYMRAWRTRNAERLRAYDRDHKAANPEQNRAKQHRRRMVKAGCGGGHTKQEWLALLTRFDGRCAYCGGGGRMTKDHVIPITRKDLGPTDSIENILPACKPCNSQKNNKTDYEFRAWLWNGYGSLRVSP